MDILRMMDYDFIYSAMTQVTGILLAIAGLFIVFKLELQRNKISSAGEVLKETLGEDIQRKPHTLQEVIDSADDRIKGLEGDLKQRGKIIVLYDALKQHVETHKETVRYGINGTVEVALLFLFYVFLLHFHITLSPLLASIFYFYSMLMTLLVVVELADMLRNMLKKEEDAYLLDFKDHEIKIPE